MSRPAKVSHHDWLSRGQDRWWLGLAVLTGAAVRFINLGKSSVWHDEGYSMMMAPMSPAEIWYRTGLDVHPPLYYLTLHYWMKLFGETEAAVRSLSVVLMLGVIVVMFYLVKQLFGQRAARLAAVFLAVAPFLVRYGQEARMYGMLAFFAALATYLLVRARTSGRRTDWLLYSLAIAAGLYTYYYVIFLIVFHWVYVAVSALWPRPSFKNLTQTILLPKWLAANLLAVVLWVPWLPTAYVQLTQIQSPPWIPKATLNTLPATFGQFLTYTDIGGRLGNLALAPLRNALFLGFVLAVGLFLLQRRQKPLPVVLMILFAGFTPVLVWLLSFGAHPKYIDRYFVFAAVAFYAMLAILYTEAWPWIRRRRLQQAFIITTLVIFAAGIGNVYRQGNHQMRQLTQSISQQYQPGDAVIAGDFYTFFDLTYYAKRQNFLPPQAYVPHQFPGCCEGRSMLHDRPQLVLKNFSDLHPTSGQAWIIGRPGDHDYFNQLPPNWQTIGRRIEMGSLAAQRYRVR